MLVEQYGSGMNISNASGPSTYWFEDGAVLTVRPGKPSPRSPYPPQRRFITAKFNTDAGSYQDGGVYQVTPDRLTRVVNTYNLAVSDRFGRYIEPEDYDQYVGGYVTVDSFIYSTYNKEPSQYNVGKKVSLK